MDAPLVSLVRVGGLLAAVGVVAAVGAVAACGENDDAAASPAEQCEVVLRATIDACDGRLPTAELANFFRNCEAFWDDEACGAAVQGFVECGQAHPTAACDESSPCAPEWLATAEPPCRNKLLVEPASP